VKTVNRLRDPDLDAAFLMRKIQGKSFGLYMSNTMPGFRLENSFRELGALDFESALSCVEQSLGQIPARSRHTRPHVEVPRRLRGEAEQDKTERAVTAGFS
jgi:hypothetical protein